METGLVCKVKIMTKRGLRHVVGLHLATKQDEDLWLLLRYADTIEDAMNVVDVIGLRGENKQMGYSAICSGNVVVTYGNSVVFKIGRIDAKQLDEVRKDIYESNRCGLLEAFRRGTVQDNFYTLLTMPKGATVIGGCTHKL